MYFIISIILTLFAVLSILFLKTKENKKLKSLLEEKEKNITGLKEDIKRELIKAQDVHKKLLPDSLPEPVNFLISDYYQPAEYIGGDYYNLFKIDHDSLAPLFNQYLFYFFDVSGHGIDSTLLAIFINESIQNYFKLKHNPGEMVSTKDLMSYIDKRYQEEGFPDDYLLCMYIGIFDLDKKELEYSARGFQFPFLKLKEKKEIKKYDIGGLPISTAVGKMEEFNTTKKMKLEKNSSLFFSTDGLFESKNENKIYYSRIDNLLKKYSFLPAPFINEIIQKDVNNFMGNKNNRDDITFLIMDYLKGDCEKWNFVKPKNKNILNKLEKKNSNGDLWYLNIINSILNKFTKNNKKMTKKSKLEFKYIDNSSYFLLVFEDKKKKINWLDFFNDFDFYNEIIFMDEISYDNITIDFFKKNKIYISKNKLGNKVYILLFKD